jgi:HSP20 family protein
MFGMTRWSPFDDIFNFQREVDRVFNQFWSELPARAASTAPSFQVSSNDDEWRIDVPLPGIDPQYVNLEVAGSTVSIRVAQPGENKDNVTRHEQTFTIPQFLDIDRVKASHQHGMLRLTFPLKESVKPRRVAIETNTPDQKQLNAAA